MLPLDVSKLIKRYFEARHSRILPPEVPRVHVDEIASRLATFYERVRNLLDYREEHLLRKRFMDRVLRRRLMLNAEGGMAEAIIKEIIRAGHLPNDQVPETKIAEIENILRHHEALHERIVAVYHNDPALENWLYLLTSRAIEENIFPPYHDILRAEIMFAVIQPNLTLRGSNLPEAAIKTQLFIAIQRALLKVDDDQLCYRVFKFIYPRWEKLTELDYPKVIEDLPGLKQEVERLLKSSSAPHFFRLANRYNTVFDLIGDVIEQFGSWPEARGALENSPQLEEEVRLAYDQRFKREKVRLNRLAFLSVLSFLISKIAVALAIEIPAEYYLTNSFSFWNATLNVLFPPALMFVIVSLIRMSGYKNFVLVFGEVEKALSDSAEKKYLVDIPKKRSMLTEFAVRLSYLAVFIAVLCTLVWLLRLINFNIANIIIFVFFVSMVAATGVRIHNRSRELSLEARKHTVLSFVFDLFAVPFITIGRWVLSALSKFNPLVVGLNLMIDVPFQAVVEFLENFRGFVKSKKDEVM